MVVQFYRYTIFFLVLIGALIWIAIFQIPDGNLHIIACDVGQGDAILATYKSFQIITDGGPPNGKLEKCLSKHIPFYDREIEIVVNTHPQLDHFGGFIDLFKNYKVDYFIASKLDIGGKEYGLLENKIGGSGIRVIRPIEGTSVRYGLIHYDIFWPTQEFIEQNSIGYKGDPNDFSVQAILSLTSFDGLLTGDMGENMKENVIPKLPDKDIEYIKIPHHGSKYGLTKDYLNKFMPKIAVISVGKNNTFGHPTPEILKMLSDKHIKTLRTDLEGDVEIITDGRGWWIKN